ncbi:MAG: Fe-S-cluster containining protein [Thermoproteota archaeon]|jgi:Fe-S-cluster containining protein
MEKKTTEEISCSTCKALCCRLEVRLIDDSDDLVPEEFTETTPDLYMIMRQSEDGYCSALDRITMKCTIYEKRPFLCREYQAGDFDCMIERKKLEK